MGNVGTAEGQAGKYVRADQQHLGRFKDIMVRENPRAQAGETKVPFQVSTKPRCAKSGR